MKAIKIFGHPMTVVILFSFLLISGESFGGLYLMYLLMALPHAALHALLGVGGLVCMLVGYKILSKSNLLKSLLYFSAVVLMLSSLFIFFNNSNGYNNATFHQVVPLVFIVLFGVCSLSNLLLATSYMLKKISKNTVAVIT